MTNLVADTERLRRLQLLGDAALSSLELDELLAALLERTGGLLDADTCAILLLDEERTELVARAALGIEEEVEQGVRIPVGRGFAGRVAAERRPVVIEDLDQADIFNPILREKGIKSMLGVPLLVRGDVIGVLHVGSLTTRYFTQEEAELLQVAAERAATSIEHARLFEAERSARTRLEHVQAVTDIALAYLGVNQLLEVLLPRIRTILAADTCAVLLLDEERNELVARAAVGIEEEVEQGVRIPVGGGFAGRVAADRRPVILDDVDHADVLNPILREKGIKSMLGVPLLVRGEVLGVLHVGTLTHRTFTDDDTELLGLVAERVALAIERGHLHEQTVALDAFKTNLVAVASHELRTPASAVYGVFVTLAERSGITPETRDELIHVGHEQSDRLRRLIEQLLDLSQLDAGRVDVNPAPVRLREAIEEIVASALVEHGSVHLEVPPDLTAVVDRLVLERILTNLVVNAERHGAPPIVLSAHSSKHELRIAVQDNGGGVPEDLEPQLFEPFTRGADSGGPGLGLSIARTYVRAHGGDLFFVPGPGARFELVIPQG
jgi:signal transduction histidine kinase